MKTRRVLVAMRYASGGTRTYILDSYPLLAERGFRFSFVGPAEPAFREFSRELAGWEGAEFVEADLSPHAAGVLRRIERRLPRDASGSLDLRTALALGITVRRLLQKRRFDLIHSHSWLCGLFSVLANVGRGVPHVFTPHGTISDGEYGGWSGRLMRRIAARILSRTDLCIAVSKAARENNVRFFPGLDRGRSRVVVIPNGVNLERLAAPSAESDGGLRTRLGISPSCFLLGYLGRLSPEKGFLVLVEALDRLLHEEPGRPFHLAAVATGDYERAYRAEVGRRGRLAECVTFLDAVPNAAPLLGQLDLLAVPSLREAFGLLAAEALCLGVPVVGSDCKGLREVLEGSPSWIVPTGDPAALAGALREAMTSPRRTQAAGYAPEARRRFDVLAGARQLAGHFQRLCNGRLS
ncbi:MAG: glycosyltransferase family 4 protein [Pirellulales bacterium]|nr:glycosyltransferase family 4 protein [Pirellulales bacterium]